jgi:hypothetical protein
MQYPLELRFKILAIAKQIAVRDAMGQLLCYVKQRAFKLKESITVFGDEAQTRPIYRINADRIIDISAQYRIERADGALLGVVKRRGMRSLWRAQYEVSGGGGLAAFLIQEANPWVKIADALLGEIPLVGLASVYLLHPRYLMTRAENGALVMEAEKQPSLLEGRFRMEARAALGPDEEQLAIMSFLLMLLLERRRG